LFWISTSLTASVACAVAPGPRVSQHTPSIRRPAITEAAMVTIPVPVLDVTRYDAAQAAVVAGGARWRPGSGRLARVSG
jgi:hypothetical protein